MRRTGKIWVCLIMLLAAFTLGARPAFAAPKNMAGASHQHMHVQAAAQSHGEHAVHNAAMHCPDCQAAQPSGEDHAQPGHCASPLAACGISPAAALPVFIAERPAALPLRAAWFAASTRPSPHENDPAFRPPRLFS